MENSSVSPASASIVKTPFELVVVPLVVPFTVTETPCKRFAFVICYLTSNGFETDPVVFFVIRRNSFSSNFSDSSSPFLINTIWLPDT